jgi:signal transduction histidine kinase
MAQLGAIALGILATALAMRTTATSGAWVNRVFPGFMLLDNRVVASVGLAHWSGSDADGLFQSEVVGVQGEAVPTTPEIYDRVARMPPGTPVRYTIREGGVERDVVVATERFTLRDWFLLFGAYLLNGVMCLVPVLVVWVLRPRAPVARALLVTGITTSLFFLTAMDLYGPATLFRVHAAAEALVPAAALQVVFVFPQPIAVRWRFVGWALAPLVLLPYQLYLYRPAVYTAFLNLDMVLVCAAAVAFAVRLVVAYRHGHSQLVRQRVQVISLGTAVGFALPGAVVVLTVLHVGGMAMNLAAVTPFLFVVSLAYAVVKQDLFEIDALVKRGAYYLLLTGAVGAAYIAAVVVFNLILQAGAVTDSPAFPLFFTLAVLLLFNPLRTRLQALVDRVFYRTRYDAARVLAAVGRELGSALKRDQITTLVLESIDGAIPNARTRLFVRDQQDGALRDVGGSETIPASLAARLADGAVLTAFDASEAADGVGGHEAVRRGMAALGAEIAVPLQLRGDLVGVLTTGAKRSGLFYGAGDVEFLRALANQAAIALENSRSYEALVELNARLEERVRERTAQLQATNRELAEAYTELKTAEVQLVQSEKMASLGRLVAGVAHEINNPVSFIATSVVPLGRRLAEAADMVPPEVRPLLREAEDIVAIMGRGAQRTAAIVKDLRSFSRLGETMRQSADLHDGLEVSLRLLESRWKDRITIHRDYGTLPLVQCDPAQLNQVFLNVLGNACDAIRGRGNVWITTRADDDAVSITVRDDGAGIPADTLGHIFDPFFTTKDVGGGTGLGLAISHSVVGAHGGRIEVESAPGAGATFRIILPVVVRDVVLDMVASSNR